MTKTILTVICIVFMFVSCNKSTRSAFNSNIYEHQELSLAMQTFFVDTLNAADTTLFSVYEKRDFAPFFIDINGITNVFDEFYVQLSEIENEGLSPEKFNFKKIGILAEKIRQNTDIQKDSLALFDYISVKSYVDLCTVLRFGAVNPKDTHLSNFYFEIEKPAYDFVEKCIENIDKNLASHIKSHSQRNKNYELIKKTRNFYAGLKDSVFEKIPVLPEKQTIKFGEIHSSVPLIIKRLLLTKEISAADADSALNYNKFDSLLLKSINIFQKKRGLVIDSEIGNSTIRELNILFKDLIKKIDVNLERMRWQPTVSLENRFIHVNVANQILTACNADSVVLQMKVCVGQEPDHLTPFLHSNIYDITLNPLWRVPQSIIIDEIAPKTEPATYIRRNRMKVYRAGVEVNPDSVKWRAINKNFSPYTVVQDSGAFNSLGRIKFNMHNNFSVYLHDTNAKTAFKLHKRNISHGCVRVEKPLELAYFCLPEMNDKKFDLIRDKILFSIERQPISAEGKRLKQNSPEALQIRNINVSPRIPVLLEYYTVFIDENNEVAFCSDIYGLDEQLYKLIW